MDMHIPFTIEVPALVRAAPSAGARPLVIVLHGQGQEPLSFARRWHALEQLDAHLVFARGIYPLEVAGAEGLGPGPHPRRIGYGWYVYDGDQEKFKGELARGVAHLSRLLDALIAKLDVDRERIALVGYSQGGYLGYVAAVRLAHRFAAFVGCAARLKTEAVAAELANPPRRFPILHVHGRGDAAVEFKAAEQTIADLKANGWPAELLAHEGGHGMRHEEIVSIRDWLNRQLCV